MVYVCKKRPAWRDDKKFVRKGTKKRAEIILRRIEYELLLFLEVKTRKFEIAGGGSQFTVARTGENTHVMMHDKFVDNIKSEAQLHVVTYA